MRVIDLEIDAPRRRVTVLSYGASRVGKTRFAATFPRPLFLSDNSEGGWETIRNMDPDAWFEPGRKPYVWSMEKAEDMANALTQLDKLCRGETIQVTFPTPKGPKTYTYKPGDIQTVVIDSMTFYADAFLNALEQASGTKADMRQIYQRLNQHLRNVMVSVHGLPLNVVWICLEKGPDEENPTGGVLLAGQTRDKAPARCDYWFYHRAFTKNAAVGPEFEVRTKKYGVWQAGGRDEGALPDPLPECSYRSMAEYLGLPTSTSEAGRYSDDEMAERRQKEAAAAQPQQQSGPQPVNGINRAPVAPTNSGRAPSGQPARGPVQPPGRTTTR